MPGRPAEQFEEMMSFRRAHGSEASLCEFLIEHVVSSGETIRAEEMLVSVPDGRSVRVLVNATPIPTEPGVHLTDVQTPWRRVRSRAELDDVRIHDLRHSCAA